MGFSGAIGSCYMESQDFNGFRGSQGHSRGVPGDFKGFQERSVAFQEASRGRMGVSEEIQGFHVALGSFRGSQRRSRGSM